MSSLTGIAQERYRKTGGALGRSGEGGGTSRATAHANPKQGIETGSHKGMVTPEAKRRDVPSDTDQKSGVFIAKRVKATGPFGVLSKDGHEARHEKNKIYIYISQKSKQKQTQKQTKRHSLYPSS